MRADGFRCKNSDIMYTLSTQFMTHRVDSMNYVTIDIPEQPLHDYIAKRRKEGVSVSHMAIVLAAYTRLISQYPELNRFVINKKFYHRNEIAISLVVLKSGTHEQEAFSKLFLYPEDTIDDVNRKLKEYIEQNRKHGDTNALDKWMNRLIGLSGLASFVIHIFKFADKHGLLPKSMIDASPFHASLLITNLASIRTNHIYHHVYEFGTTSVSIAMGNTREVPSRNRKTDEIEFTKCIPFGIVMDERIAKGTYFGAAFKTFQKYLANPEMLDEKPDKIVYDKDVKNIEERFAKLRAKRENKANKKK